MNTNIYDEESFFKAYGEMPRSQGGLKAAGEWHVLEPLFPEMKGKNVLDLGCGYGWHCKYAADHGAKKIVGIDLSQRMIDEACVRNHAENIEYRVCSILEFEYPEEGFDLVISNLVLHYIEDLNDIYRKVKRTLKKGGTFLFNIEHPVFTAGVNQEWIVDTEQCALY